MNFDEEPKSRFFGFFFFFGGGGGRDGVTGGGDVNTRAAIFFIKSISS